MTPKRKPVKRRMNKRAVPAAKQTVPVSRRKTVPFLCLLLVILISILTIVIISRKGAPAGEPAREQTLMQQARSKNVIRCPIKSINNFFIVYYGAMSSGNTSVLEDAYDNPKLAGVSAAVGSIVEKYTDIKCYVTPGLKQGEVVAFVSYNIHFYNIDEPAPGVDSFYLKMDSVKDTIKIMTAMNSDPDINNFMLLLSYRNPVRTLMKDTQERLYNVLQENTDLRNLYVVMGSIKTEQPGTTEESRSQAEQDDETVEDLSQTGQDGTADGRAKTERDETGQSD